MCDPTSRPAREFVRSLASQGLRRRPAGPRFRGDGGAVRRVGAAPRAQPAAARGLLPGRPPPPRPPAGAPTASPRAAAGTSTRTTGSHRRAGSAPSPRRRASPEPWWPTEDEVDAEVRERPRPLGEGPRRSSSSARTGRASSPPPAPRRWTPWSGSSSTASTASARTRTRCSPGTGGCRTRCSRRPHQPRPAATRSRSPDRVVRAYHEGGGPAVAVSRASCGRWSAGASYVWHVYWHTGEEYRARATRSAPTRPCRRWFAELDPDGEVQRELPLGTCCARVREDGWTHHIQRLMVLGNWGLQRGYDAAQLADWFQRSFVDGYDWVMLPNVVGMSPARGRRLHGDEAVRGRGRLHQPDERLLRRLPLRPEGRGSGTTRAPSRPATGPSWPATGTGSRATRG